MTPSIAANTERPALRELVASLSDRARVCLARSDAPDVVVSPYRFNPLGAHVDHQGGQVLARTIDQYTVLCFWPSDDDQITLYTTLESADSPVIRFRPGELPAGQGWQQMATATAAALADVAPLTRGIDALVHGTLISGGLSSSASVILAYLKALAEVNGIELSSADLVELCRRVENDYRGLNNGLQDQMSIAFAARDSMSYLDMQSVSGQRIADPATVDEVRFLLLYSGVSRDLAGSGFNTRVSECQAAAAMLQPGARHLGEVDRDNRSEQRLASLPDVPRKRALHVYSEIARVDAGARAWAAGDFVRFGELMNASCRSSIDSYESGSEWLIRLQEIALETPGVLGSRFSGGGYGGCLVMLVKAPVSDQVASQTLSRYLDSYPALKSQARVMRTCSEGSVRVLES